MTDTIMCHAGSKVQHHWYAGQREALSTSWIFVLRLMRLAFRGDGKSLAGTRSGVQLYLAQQARVATRSPRKLLKSVEGGVLGVICGPLRSGFL